jgi:hypothetical protein
MLAPQVKAAEEAIPTGVADEAYAIAFGAYTDATAALPEDFFDWKSDIVFPEYSVTVPFLDGKGRPFPYILNGELFGVEPNMSYYRSGTNIFNFVKADPRWDQVKLKLHAYRDRVSAAYTAQNNAAEEATKFLANYTTLAPALKAWPALWGLLPLSAKEAHERKTERKKTVMPTPEFGDAMHALTAAVITSRMTKKGE